VYNIIYISMMKKRKHPSNDYERKQEKKRKKKN